MKPLSKAKIALVYDRVNSLGGAERVLELLLDLYPQSPLYTSVYSQEKAAWAHKYVIKPSILQRIPWFRQHHQWLAPLMPLAFESFNLSHFDIVISITSAEAKGVLTKPHQLHVCYLLTPTRYLWSHASEYLAQQAGPLLNLPFASLLRQWDFQAAQRPDAIIAISQEVAQRCLKYYRRTPNAIIYPPVDTDAFARNTKPFPYSFSSGYLIMVGRLVEYKQFSSIISLMKQLPNQQLLIVGQGPHASKFQRQAPTNCHFLGHVSHEQLTALYTHAKALLFPQREDFGIISLEAQACGTPVIGLDQAGARETIKPGVTGLLIKKFNLPHLRQAIKILDHTNWYHGAIRKHALQWGKQRFVHQFHKELESLWQQHQSR